VDAEPKPDVAELAKLIDELPAQLREQALTHASWVDDRAESFERFAFLGDSVLALAVALQLFDQFPQADAGGLTQIHNQVVSGVACTEVGRELGVPEMLRAAEPEGHTGISADVLIDGERPLPEATEALIGACLLTYGFDVTAGAVAAAFEDRIEHVSEHRVDFKSALQELLARRKTRVSYEVVGTDGPPHRQVFSVVAIVDSERVGEGEGRSKKAAEQAAAEQALERLGG
jgi:ribonuclease-3